MKTTQAHKQQAQRRKGMASIDKQKAVNVVWAFCAVVAFVMTVHALPEFLSQFH